MVFSIIKVFEITFFKRRKQKKGFETKKEAITYERNFTAKMSGSLNMLFEDYFELYKSYMNETVRLIVLEYKFTKLIKKI